MPKLALVLAALCAAAFAGPPAVQAADRSPRTASGAPDFQGLWSVNSTTKLERPSVYPSLVITEAQARAIPRPPVFADDDVGQEESEWQDPGWTLARVGGEIRTSWLVDPPDGRLPYTELGAKLVSKAWSSDGPESRPGNDRCLTMMHAGPPMINAGGSNIWEILQTRDHVVIAMEGNHETRIVPLRARDAPIPKRPADWRGHSVGWYEGDTLVIRTSGFHAEQQLRRSNFARLYLSQDAVVTERLQRLSPRQLLYSYEVHDPAIFRRDWRAEMPLNATKGPIFESACHEGNYSMAGILAGARADERQAAAARPIAASSPP